MNYESVRQKYRPANIKILLIAESPSPAPEIQSSRQFYYSERIRKDDRLFTNTIRAIFPEAATLPEPELEQNKQQWLEKLMEQGFYMIEALEESQEHRITKKDRQLRISQSLSGLIERIRKLSTKDTKIILIKSNVFEVAAKPLQEAGFNILNTELVDYPGRFNQRSYREKLAKLLS